LFFLLVQELWNHGNGSAIDIAGSLAIFALFAWLISQQPAVLLSEQTRLFSQNKPAPAISHQPTEQADCLIVFL
jgi:hypothetical protein